MPSKTPLPDRLRFALTWLEQHSTQRPTFDGYCGLAEAAVGGTGGDGAYDAVSFSELGGGAEAGSTVAVSRFKPDSLPSAPIN